MTFNSRVYPPQKPKRRSELPDLDEADWMDWEHWQSTEEIQHLMCDMTDSPLPPDDNAGADGDRQRISSKLERFGLQVDG